MALAFALSAFLAAGALHEEVSLLQTMPAGAAPSFADFVRQHGRDYGRGSAEYALRQGLYEDRVSKALRHNSRAGRLWTAGVNHLSDWTQEEFEGLLGWRGAAPRDVGHGGRGSFLLQSLKATGREVEEHVWNASTVGAPQDQGACGSCWAVATSKMLETNHFIQTGHRRSFSAQELVNCVPNPQSCGGDGGCQGATVELAMAQVMQHGLASEADVPYSGSDQRCSVALMQDNDVSLDGYAGMSLEELVAPGTKRVEWASFPASRGIGLSSWTKLAVNKEEPLRAALLQGAVAISVQGRTWSSYWSGIFDGCDRDAVIDHAVVAIGFGIDEGTKYWTIMNSWGPHWGEEGKIRLLRTGDDHCGTDSQPEVGTGCKGGPSSVNVCGMCGMYYDSVAAGFREP